MADLPRRSDRSDPTRYDTLRDLENQKAEPTRPETVRSPFSGWPQDQRMDVQEAKAQSAANELNRAAQRQEARNYEKQELLKEAAREVAPKEKTPERQQERQQDREQER